MQKTAAKRSKTEQKATGTSEEKRRAAQRAKHQERKARWERFWALPEEQQMEIMSELDALSVNFEQAFGVLEREHRAKAKDAIKSLAKRHGIDAVIAAFGNAPGAYRGVVCIVDFQGEALPLGPQTHA